MAGSPCPGRYVPLGRPLGPAAGGASAWGSTRLVESGVHRRMLHAPYSSVSCVSGGRYQAPQLSFSDVGPPRQPACLQPLGGYRRAKVSS